jgi:hypothetical protein
MEPKQRTFKLPVSIVTQGDVTKLISELENIDEFFLQTKVRRAGEGMTLPRTSPEMEDVLRQNSLNLLQVDDRERLKFILMTIRNKSPVIHMSFSVSPSQKFLEKIISWMRQNVSEIVVLQVGLQPNIGAGFTIRTTNKFFDFSLRQHLNKSKDILIAELRKRVEVEE